jgi:hypothetical protein
VPHYQALLGNQNIWDIFSWKSPKPLIGYRTAVDSLPESGSALIYLLAGNGVFASTARPVIKALMPVCLSN